MPRYSSLPPATGSLRRSTTPLLKIRTLQSRFNHHCILTGTHNRSFSPLILTLNQRQSKRAHLYFTNISGQPNSLEHFYNQACLWCNYHAFREIKAFKYPCFSPGDRRFVHLDCPPKILAKIGRKKGQLFSEKLQRRVSSCE